MKMSSNSRTILRGLRWLRRKRPSEWKHGWKGMCGPYALKAMAAKNKSQ